ncbi:hypothetical protein BDZ45DRAFT_744848 [Acephala macrosclerotiorum]|nr:hypothetical protein BDZ45DRAFT_744848 [Acephala macrosclerotiorum]
MTLASPMDNYKLVYFIPPSHLQATKHAIFEAGGGVYANGKYIQCAFEIQGSGKLEKTEEFRVEIKCPGRDVVKKAVEVLEQPVNPGYSQRTYLCW